MKRTILKDENGRGYEESLRIDIERDSAKSIATSSNAENVNVITTNPENLESSFENIKKGYNDLRLMNERSIGIGCKLRFTCHFISKSNLNWPCSTTFEWKTFYGRCFWLVWFLKSESKYSELRDKTKRKVGAFKDVFSHVPCWLTSSHIQESESKLHGNLNMMLVTKKSIRSGGGGTGGGEKIYHFSILFHFIYKPSSRMLPAEPSWQFFQHTWLKHINWRHIWRRA